MKTMKPKRSVGMPKGLAKRPPKLKGKVANDFAPPPARSATMPAPTKDIMRPTRGR